MNFTYNTFRLIFFVTTRYRGDDAVGEIAWKLTHDTTGVWIRKYFDNQLVMATIGTWFGLEEVGGRILSVIIRLTSFGDHSVTPDLAWRR